jgi:thiol-disulfide isomerase/thioredoxin
MPKNLLNFALIAALISLPALAGCGSKSPSTSSSAKSSGASGSVPPEFNQKISALDGSELSLSKYQGKVVLVNFWATWCDPCRGEIPWLIDFQKKYGDKGLVILGVAMDEEGKTKVEPWVAKERFNVNGNQEPMNYPILLGTDHFSEQFGGLIGMPTSYLYSRDGKKVKTVIGIIKRDELSKTIESLL